MKLAISVRDAAISFLLLCLVLALLPVARAQSDGGAGADSVGGSSVADPDADKPPVDKRKRLRGKSRQKRSSSRPAEGDTFRLLVPVWRPSGSETPWDAFAFRAAAGGQEAAIVGERFDDSPLLLFVAIDFSGELILTEAAKTALSTAIASARPEVLPALLRIPEQPTVILDPTTDRPGFVDAMRSLPMSGRAGLFEMMEVIAGVTSPLVRQHPVRVAVLYLTDSEISNYREDYTNPVINRSDSRDLSRRFPDVLIREKVNTLTNMLLRSSVPVFIVHLRYRNDTLNESYQAGLRRLAETTGGQGVFCRSIAEIPVVIGDIVNAIQAMGMLEVEAPAGISGAFTLSLESEQGAVQHRTMYMPPR